MGATERIKEYLEDKGLSKYKFYKKTGFSNKFLDNSSNMGTNKAEIILRYYPEINSEWLLTGKGAMIKDPSHLSDEELKKRGQDRKAKMKEFNYNFSSSIKEKGTPLIPLDAMAGFGEGDTQVMDYDTERYIVPEFDELNVDFMIRVKGSSMYPKYNSGDIVACKKLPLGTFFQWNKVYVLDTVQGPMIKRVKKSTLENNILIVSDNISYDPFDLHTDELYSLAIVVGVIRLE